MAPPETLETGASNVFRALGYLSEEEMAELRGVKVAQLRNDRAEGIGPPHTKFGKRVVYPITGLRAYLEKHTVSPSTAPTMIQGQRARRSNRTAT